MKIYAIGYENINGKLNYFMYTCKFFSVRQKINLSFYDELTKVFNVAHKNNKSLSGMYFDTI